METFYAWNLIIWYMVKHVFLRFIHYLPPGTRYFKRLILVLYGAARLLFTLQNATERFLLIKMGNYCK